MTQLRSRCRSLPGLTGVLVFAMLVMAPLSASGQSCALCYTQAAKSGAQMIAALKSGILILVIPPMLLTAGFFRILYQKRNQFKDSDSTSAGSQGW
jgi:hypothetical protein